MVTSDSDTDFESADEGRNGPLKKDTRITYWTSPTVDSESDDDTEYVQHAPYKSSNWQRRKAARSNVVTGQETLVGDKDDKIDSDVKGEGNVHIVQSVETFDNQKDMSSIESKKSLSSASAISVKDKKAEFVTHSSTVVKSDDAMSKVEPPKAEKASERTQQRNLSHRLGAKKLATRITKDNDNENKEAQCSNKRSLEPISKDSECELQKDKKQPADDQSKATEIFQPEGWEGLGNDIELPDDLMEEKLEPVLEKLSLANKEPENSLGNWSSWGNWDVTSLLSTATASVSTLTTHVSQGLTLLEGTIGIQDPRELAETEQDKTAPLDGVELETQEKENQSYSTFGFGNLISGVSSITKLVESTGKEFTSKVMTGGLDTLEAIGKKTMEVLQDGDPGLKKKRAFFMNEPEKPNLSQILREAKEKAETEQKTIEERQLARKVHFESLFDDYQGLVHLEALEILSKQSNMKIQQYLIELDENELTSVQETLEEIKQLCNLNDVDDIDDDDKNNKDLKNKLQNACHELGVDITYEKLYNVWTETKSYLASSSTHTDQEIFQNAISTLAQFTAFSIERFHKTAELLLIKERRSTVNEADALVQLTNILSDQINLLANSFYDTLHQQFAETVEKPNNIETNLERISSEACNANSYIQDAFKLLIPILQVGAI
ncbi:protein FAM114A2 isoform X2 [Cataglyphis hispanica]|uniref:protein FAM114A2 isoform X2 n=1 Tax=Cataglyphis hispanica TaxID=1086592 RepID=UPI0021802E15|nr:protein FAM114A2 isoform X2 [Cataglyphis hispanica]